jgi:hypothetical protein
LDSWLSILLKYIELVISICSFSEVSSSEVMLVVNALSESELPIDVGGERNKCPIGLSLDVGLKVARKANDLSRNIK